MIAAAHVELGLLKGRKDSVDVGSMTPAETLEASYSLVPELEVHLPSTESAAYEHSDLREFLALLRRHAVLIVVATVLTGALTYVFTARETKQYASGTTLLYSASSSGEDPTRAVDTLVGVSSSSAVLSPVAARYKLTLAELAGSLTISGNSNADIITISATYGSPVQAARIANGVARQLISYSATGQRQVIRANIASLQRQLQTFSGRTDPSALATASDLRTQLAQARANLAVAAPPLAVLSPAVTPSGAVSPHPTRDGAIGLLVGLVLGVMLGALRDRLDRRIHRIEEIEAIYRAPMLGVVPFMKSRLRNSRSKALADFSGSGALADAYRTIRTNLMLLRLNGKDPAVVVVTSAAAEEGKSTVAANLAHALSVTGRHVLAVSADLHNPTLHEYFAPLPETQDSRVPSGRSKRVSAAPRRGAGRKPAGLVQVLAGEVDLEDAARSVPLSRSEQARGGTLHVLADSSTFFDPAVLLSSGAMQEFLKEAGRVYDVIVFDTPPLLANADATLLAQEGNILVVVARLELLTKNQARRAVQVMASTHLVPTGIIVTGEVDEPIYGYGYRFDYEDDAATNGADGRAHTSS